MKELKEALRGALGDLFFEVIPPVIFGFVTVIAFGLILELTK